MMNCNDGVELTEKWDMSMVKALVTGKHTDQYMSKRDSNTLGRVWRGQTTTIIKSVVTYNHAKFVSGRVYGKPNTLQSAKCAVRRLVMSDLYFDVDMSNALPSILLGYCKRHHIKSGLLAEYVSDRSEIFTQLKQTYIGATDADLKTMILAFIHSGNGIGGLPGHVTVPCNTSPWIVGLQTEVLSIVNQLIAIPEYQTHWDEIQSMVNIVGNPKGTFIARLCQIQENKLLHATSHYLQNTCGFTIGMFVFDGLLVEKKVGVEFTPELLVKLSDVGFRQTGFRVHWLVKDMKPTTEDMEFFAKVVGVITPPVPAYTECDLLPLTNISLTDSVVFTPEDEDDARRYDSSMCIFPGTITKTDQFVQPLVFNKGEKMIIIQANMNQGKSHSVREYLKQHKPKRVLFLTARQQQAHSLVSVDQLGGAEFNQAIGGSKFIHYQDVEPETKLGSIDRLVLQYESLHRLGSAQILPYDIVICDEIRGVVAQSVVSATNKRNLQTNFKIFTGLLKYTKSILLDADVSCDGMVRRLVEDIHPDRQLFSVYHYTFQSIPRSILLLDGAAALIDDAIQALVDGKRIMMCFRSKRDMKAFVSMPELVNINKLFFSGDSTNEHMKKFQTIDAEVEKVQLLAITSKVTVAADVQVMFHRVYIHADTRGGCSPRDVYQMSGRARRVFDTRIHVALPTDDSVRNESGYRSELRLFRDNKKCNEEMLELAASQEWLLDNSTKSFVWSPGTLVRIAAWAAKETHEGFVTGFTRNAIRKQWPISWAPKATEVAKLDALKNIQKEMSELKKLHTNEQKVALAETASAVLTQSIEDRPQFESDMLSLEKHNMMSMNVHDTPELRCMRVIRNMKPLDEIATLGLVPVGADITNAIENRAKLAKLGILHRILDHRIDLSVQEQTVVVLDTARLMASNFPESASQQNVSTAILENTMFQLGMPSVFDGSEEERTITATSLNVPDIAEKIEMLNVAAKRDGRRPSRSPDVGVPQLVCALRRELNTAGCDLVTMKRSRKDRNVDPTYRLEVKPDLERVYQMMENRVGADERFQRGTTVDPVSGVRPKRKLVQPTAKHVSFKKRGVVVGPLNAFTQLQIVPTTIKPMAAI